MNLKASESLNDDVDV